MKEYLFHFGDVLNFYMMRESVTPDELSTRTQKYFGESQRVPKSTIVHWLKHEAKPREWIPIIKIAVALHLTEWVLQVIPCFVTTPAKKPLVVRSF